MLKKNSKGKQGKYLKNFINFFNPRFTHTLTFHIRSNFRKILFL